MAFDRAPNSTPKLYIHKQIPCKSRKPSQMQMLSTPPLQPSLSIPFIWEEIPGKPKLLEDTNQAANILLQGGYIDDDDDDVEMTEMPSPVMVLDGPDEEGHSLSLSCTFSFRKAQVRRAKDKGSCGSFSSARWRCYEDEAALERGILDSSPTLGDMLKRESSIKIRVRKRRSFLNMCCIKS